ncbi:DUF4433 domain-containing protein [Myroides odoratimimus]|uniref:type II toxin-antitoxin system toxin DNA ADP-ribosyl transferase DarT n=1 Tax=Myroides odoratimimus TaxID=76832 RepID=UPI002576927A|nr:DUF4433 domain-containing protein [Myroides odoratimimus]MDM1444414.1 DUF4433 domain-containing protein [Myroides odoratimimus]
MIINGNKEFCYRIIHIDNLANLLANGIVSKHHPNANGNYVNIGNSQIIDVRDTMQVRIDNYGFIGEYVPFYFTPRSIMLLNIITGYQNPVVPKRDRKEILVIRCLISDLVMQPKWFFTDGQGNNQLSNHFNNLVDIDKIDWQSIQTSSFSKSKGDYDLSRRYQAEFLVHQQVPLQCIESLNVYSEETARTVQDILNRSNVTLQVNVQPFYFF